MEYFHVSKNNTDYEQHVSVNSKTEIFAGWNYVNDHVQDVCLVSLCADGILCRYYLLEYMLIGTFTHTHTYISVWSLCSAPSLGVEWNLGNSWPRRSSRSCRTRLRSAPMTPLRTASSISSRRTLLERTHTHTHTSQDMLHRPLACPTAAWDFWNLPSVAV